MENLYRTFIEALEDCDFTSDLNENTCESLIMDYVDDKVLVDYCCGATKMVLFPLSKISTDLVVKIPFNTSTEQETDYDEEADDYIYGDYLPLDGAMGPISWNYIAGEEYIYDSARIYDVQQYFLKNTYIGSINDYPIYVQQKALIFEDRLHSDYSERKSTKQEQNIYRTISERYYNPFPMFWSLDFIQAFGLSEFEELLNFCAKENLCDLHAGNLGYINGLPIIIDYGGYNS